MNAPERMPAAAAAHTDSEFERLLSKPFTPVDLMQADNLDNLERIAQRMANGKVTVPEHLRGNVGDCMAIAIQAMLWNMDPFAVAQKTHIVSGRLGYEAQLVNAVLQNSGAIRGAPHYEYRGEGTSLECRAGCVLRGEQQVRWNEWLSIAAVTTKNSPLWKTNPKQQMGYLQIKNWARAFAPGAILGVYTTDELQDMQPADAPWSSTPTSTGTGAAATKPELPAYSDETFEQKLPEWQKLIDPDNGKTGEALLAKLSTKATFSDAQKARIKALQKLAPKPADNPPPAGEHADFIGAMDAAEGGAK